MPVPELVIQDFNDGHLAVYRIVRSDNVEDPVFTSSLKSHYELDMPPKRIEKRSAAIHMGISVFRTREQAVSTARAWPVIGDHIAKLELCAGHGFNLATTGSGGHLTLWADPVKLAAVADEVTSVED